MEPILLESICPLLIKKEQFFPSKTPGNLVDMPATEVTGETMKSALLVLILSVFSTQTYATTIPNDLGAPKAGGLPRESSSAYEIVYGSIRVGQELQRVIVTIPPGAAPKPALLFVGGMGCYSLDFSGTGPKAEAYQHIIDNATRKGFVTMRVEKTGMGDSLGTPCEQQDFHREVAGFLEGLKTLASYPFVKADSLYIFGHSIGGVIAPLLAAQVQVKGIAVLGTLATDWYHYDMSNNCRQYLLSGVSPAQIDQFMVYPNTVSQEFYLNKKSPDQIRQEHPEVSDYMQFPMHWTYMQQLSEVNPEIDWNQSNAHIVILSAESDYLGSQSDELQRMIQKANESRTAPIRLVRLPKTDHFFRTANSQQESFANHNADGSPLDFQNNILQVLTKELFSLK